jgi:predicted metal-dependent phosphoesterase TrpH
MVDKLIEAGYRITWDEVQQYAQGGSAVFKQHIMHALMDQGYCMEILGPLHKKLFSRGDEGTEPGIAYIPMQYVDAKAAIRAVREAGGVPVLAHPGQLHNFEAIPEWVVEGLEGIEAVHPSHSAADEERAQAYAAEYDLVLTGGSDFHGMYGSGGRHGSPAYPLGSVDAGLACVAELEKRKSKLTSI